MIRFFFVFVSALVVATGASRAAEAQARFVESPYVDRVIADTATLHVKTSTRVPVHVEFDTGGQKVERTSSEGFVHRIVVSGLPHDTVVRYRVDAPGHRHADGRFRTPPDAGGRTIDFVALGDCRDGDAAHGEVIRSVRGEPDFLLHLGDYVPSGIDDGQWATFFGIAQPLLARTAIVPTLGNHEIIAPSGLGFYREHFALPDPESAYFTYDFGAVRIIVLDSNAPLDRGSAQYDFAMRELERAETDLQLRGLFVAIHQGPYSSGRHGGLEVLTTSGIVDAMRRARVDLVLSGHDHDYERGTVDGLKYVVTGGCGSPLYEANSHEPYQQVFASAHHHTRIEVAHDRIVMDVRRSDGSRIERCSFGRGSTAFRCGGRRVARSEVGTTYLVDELERFLPYVAFAIGAIALAVLLEARRRRGVA